MKISTSAHNSSIRTIFLLALTCSLGGVLIATASAQLSMPIVAWVSFYLGLTGFAFLLVLLIVAVLGDLAQNVRKTPAADPRN